MTSVSTAVRAARAPLGFGCGSVGGSRTYREDCALVEAAYEAGFRHFDLAPSYGLGHAERIVGDVLRSVRSEVTLVTKVGIARPRAGSSLRFARRLLSPIKRLLPSLWARGAGRLRSAAVAAGRFDPSHVRASLSESLRLLQTAHVDALLLHEVSPDEISPALLEALADLVEKGLCKRVGLGTSVADAEAILGRRSFELVQLQHHWSAFTQRSPAAFPNTITHGCVREGLRVIETPRFRSCLAERAATGDLPRLLDDKDRTPYLLAAAASRLGHLEAVLVTSTKVERVRRLFQASQADELDLPALQLNEIFRGMAS